MISKNQLKLIRSLAQKKYRKQHQLFLVQGEKNVLELFDTPLVIHSLFVTEAFATLHQAKLANLIYTLTDDANLAKASTIVSNNAALAVVNIPPAELPNDSQWLIALDGVSDPGNLGTIIRVADWYGIKHIIASEACADPYNPKTISATMGSFARVSVTQVDLPVYLANSRQPIYGAYLGGENVHRTQFSQTGILLMGSESHGIGKEAGEHVTNKITIPAFGHAESLNVAMATGIILDNIFRT